MIFICRRAGPPVRRDGGGFDRPRDGGADRPPTSGFDRPRDSGFDKPRESGFDKPRAAPGFGRDDSIDRTKQQGDGPERRRENFSANKVTPAEDSWRKK